MQDWPFLLILFPFFLNMMAHCTQLTHCLMTNTNGWEWDTYMVWFGLVWWLWMTRLCPKRKWCNNLGTMRFIINNVYHIYIQWFRNRSFPFILPYTLFVLFLHHHWIINLVYGGCKFKLFSMSSYSYEHTSFIHFSLSLSLSFAHQKSKWIDINPYANEFIKSLNPTHKVC